MITKRNATDQLLLLLGRTNTESRFDPREISLHVGQVRDELLVAEYEALTLAALKKQEPAPGVPAEWVSAFPDVEVAHDTVRGRDYVQLPFEPLALGDGLGLHSIAPMSDEFTPFVPTKPGSLGLLRNHPGFALGGRPGYWREPGVAPQPSSAWFQRTIKGDHPTVLVKLVCAATDLADDAPTFLPSHLQPKLIDLVRQRYATKPAAETTNDNRDQL